MEKLIIKIGKSMSKDLKEIYMHPEKGKPGTHTLYLKSAEELYELLSPKRIELLSFVINESREKTISEISKNLKRKQEAVSRDANVLTKHGLIQKIRQKQAIKLKANYDSLQISLTN